MYHTCFDEIIEDEGTIDAYCDLTIAIIQPKDADNSDASFVNIYIDDDNDPFTSPMVSSPDLEGVGFAPLTDYSVTRTFSSTALTPTNFPSTAYIGARSTNASGVSDSGVFTITTSGASPTFNGAISIGSITSNGTAATITWPSATDSDGSIINYYTNTNINGNVTLSTSTTTPSPLQVTGIYPGQHYLPHISSRKIMNIRPILL